MRISIQSTWDGGAARPEERAVLDLVREPGHWVLELEAAFHDDPAPPGPAGPTPELWQYEVVELFLLAPPDHYLEVELGPHGHHLVLELRGVRQVVRDELSIDFRAEIDGARWRGRARIPDALVPPDIARLNAFAIHGQRERRRHLAFVPVPGPAPDFHRLERYPELAPELLKHHFARQG
ncbi:MAG: hypothetical protein VX681_16150 [Myxococcota bacterium]|nr:hypothetical protein [Myxococcota bacterium]